MIRLVTILALGGILSGCDGVSSEQFDMATGTFCLQEERLSAIEKKLGIKVPEDKKMRCNVYAPQFGTTISVRTK